VFAFGEYVGVSSLLKNGSSEGVVVDFATGAFGCTFFAGTSESGLNGDGSGTAADFEAAGAVTLTGPSDSNRLGSEVAGG